MAEPPASRAGTRPPTMIYFAYDRAMNRNEMAALCPGARPLDVARIPHHFLTFTGTSDRWDGGTATIGLAPGRDLWGGLFEIGDDCRRKLESESAAEGYVWAWTDVERRDGTRVRSGLLVKVRDLEPHAPSSGYLELIDEAWRQWGLDPGGVLPAGTGSG